MPILKSMLIFSLIFIATACSSSSNNDDKSVPSSEKKSVDSVFRADEDTIVIALTSDISTPNIRLTHSGDLIQKSSKIKAETNNEFLEIFLTLESSRDSNIGTIDIEVCSDTACETFAVVINLDVIEKVNRTVDEDAIEDINVTILDQSPFEKTYQLESPTETFQVSIPDDILPSIDNAAIYINNFEIGIASAESSWLVDFPTTYWADGKNHSVHLLITTVEGEEFHLADRALFKVGQQVTQESMQLINHDSEVTLIDTDNISFEFTPVQHAANYSLRFTNDESNESILENDLPTFNITDLHPGSYQVSYRANLVDSDGSSIRSPWSTATLISVLQPTLPEILEVKIKKENNDYALTINVDGIHPDDIYHIELFDKELTSEEFKPHSNYVFDDDLFTVSELTLNQYKWRLTRENHLGQLSSPSELQLINVGTYETILGSDGSETGAMLLPLTGGQLMVIGSTNSSSITGKIGDQMSNWMVKLDETGNQVWDLVFDHTTHGVITDAIELSTQEVIVSHRLIHSAGSILIKYDTGGNQIWSKTFSIDIPDGKLTIDNLVEIPPYLYALSSIHDCYGCEKTATQSIEKFAIDSGESVSNHAFLYGSEEFKIVSSLRLNSKSEIIASGFSGPNEGFSTSFRFFSKFDANLNMTADYIGTTTSEIMSIGATVLSDDSIVLVGGHSAGEPTTITLIDAENNHQGVVWLEDITWNVYDAFPWSDDHFGLRSDDAGQLDQIRMFNNKLENVLNINTSDQNSRLRDFVVIDDEVGVVLETVDEDIKVRKIRVPTL